MKTIVLDGIEITVEMLEDLDDDDVPVDARVVLMQAGYATCYQVTDTEGWWTTTEKGQELLHQLSRNEPT